MTFYSKKKQKKNSQLQCTCYRGFNDKINGYPKTKMPKHMFCKEMNLKNIIQWKNELES